MTTSEITAPETTVKPTNGSELASAGGSASATETPAAGEAKLAPTPAAGERKELGEHTTAPWKIGVLSLCPARYYLSAVAKDPRRKESGFEAQVGTLLHHGIEQVAWLRTWISVGKNEALTPDELLRGIDQVTTNKSVEAARRNPEALAEARLLAKKVAKHVDMGGLMIESVGTKLRPLVEEPWTLDVGEVNGKRVVVGGIWDFVRRRKGRVVITDWKKGGDVRGTDELRLDPAATLYAAAAHARWPKEHVRVEHYYLTRGISSGLDWTPEVDEWARMAALEHARAVLAFEKAGEWPATPSVRACSFCNFKGSCSAYRDRVTNGMGLAAFDPSKFGELEVAVSARAKAAEDAKLAERWIGDLDQVLEPVVARAAEAGEDELVVAGHVVRRGKRSTHSFPIWRNTIRRLWELTGIAPEEIEDSVLSFRIGAVEDLLAARGFSSEDRDRVVEVLKNETAEERSSTWVEVRAIADPTPTVDVSAILATGTKIPLPPPAPPEVKNPTNRDKAEPEAEQAPASASPEIGGSPVAASGAPAPGREQMDGEAVHQLASGAVPELEASGSQVRSAAPDRPLEGQASQTASSKNTEPGASPAQGSEGAALRQDSPSPVPQVATLDVNAVARIPFDENAAITAIAVQLDAGFERRIVTSAKVGATEIVSDEPLDSRSIANAISRVADGAEAWIVTRRKSRSTAAAASTPVTPVLTDEFKCDVCGKVCKDKRGLGAHKRSHKTQEPAS